MMIRYVLLLIPHTLIILHNYVLIFILFTQVDIFYFYHMINN